MVNVRSRDSWGARPPRSRQTVSWSARQEVTLHYATGSIHQTPRSIQNFHMDTRGWSDVGYNFLVDHQGNAYEGRGWTVVGAHAAPRNQEGIGICYIGPDGMTAAAKATVVQLYDEACRRAGRTLDRLGHRDINSTSCPGTDNYTWWKSSDFRDITNVGGIDPLIGLKKGDSGEAVRALQVIITEAGRGAALGSAGVDGHYGDGTAEGLRLCRADAGSRAEAHFGDEVTGWAYGQLMAALAIHKAKKHDGATSGTAPAPSLEGATLIAKITKVEA